jgi:hypothetical protein
MQIPEYVMGVIKGETNQIQDICIIHFCDDDAPECTGADGLP